MTQKDTLIRLWDHVEWANSRLGAHLGDHRVEAVRLFAHLVAAEGVWVGRIQEESEPRNPVFPDWDMAETVEQAGELVEEYQWASPEGYARVVGFRGRLFQQ